MSAYSLEQSLRSLEQAYAMRITIIDREGFFHDHAGDALFPRERHSHQHNPACKAQFDQRCIQHCRHHINTVGEKKKSAFEHQCWKGISEIAVPLFLNHNHLGTCFIGQWQARRKKDRSHNVSLKFKNTFLHAYQNLPMHDRQNIATLKLVAPFIAQSLVLHVQQLKNQHYQYNLQNRHTPPNPRQQNILNFIQQRPGTALSLKDLATHLSLSPSRCSHLVKELFKRSLHDLIHEERIKRSCQLLRNSDHSAQEIAHIVGFNDQYHLALPMNLWVFQGTLSDNRQLIFDFRPF